ncbi:MAG: NRDE family protein [Ekhidna sp.]
MCLVVFAYKTHPKYKLIMAANRDEFYARPTAETHWWEDHDILGGRDLQAKGTWMGVNKRGHFATVTNFRDINNIKDDARSRGDLPVNFLIGDQSSNDYSQKVFSEAQQYNGFNLLTLGDEMTHVSNYSKDVTALSSGVYGLSNALLDSSWPKVNKSKELLRNEIEGNFDLEDLIDLMQNTEVAKDDELPETGLSLEMERAVSAMCIRTENYGTCCSTAITMDYEGNVKFMEKSYPFGNRKNEVKSFSFEIEK